MARFTLPTLYAKKTSMRQWRVFVKGDKITKEWGVVDGKLQTDKHPVKTTTKNEGKSNETTPEYQARLEATSLWVKKLDTGYAPDSKDVKGVNLANNIKALKRGQSNLNRNLAKTDLEKKEQLNRMCCFYTNMVKNLQREPLKALLLNYREILELNSPLTISEELLSLIFTKQPKILYWRKN